MSVTIDDFKNQINADSDEDVDQLQYLRDGSVKPGMFVSGWEDPNDAVDEDTNPTGKINSIYNIRDSS